MGQGTGEKSRGMPEGFRGGLGQFLNETSPARLERAWELERAFEARRQRMETAGKDSA
jgi:hypothetical protein